MIIAAPRIFDGRFELGPGAVEIADGRIIRVIQGAVDADITLEEGFLSPGLIDLHNNGAFGVDCATATPPEWDDYIAGLARHGVTGVLPTIITAPIPDLLAAAARVADAKTRHSAILGLHLEGPFLSPARRGAHRADWLLEPSGAALDALLADDRLCGILSVITLAPELPGALTAIARLTGANIHTALGHTDATAAQMEAAARAGARLVTHLFNAQSPLHHRAPGAPGAALTDPLLHPCLITDGVHVDPLLLRLAFAACPRAIAVTDSISLAGLAPGARADFGGAEAVLGEDGAARRADGTLAGAGITLDEGVRRLIKAGVPFATALAAATSRPAAALGLADRGRIAPGARADLIWWHDDLTIAEVWTAGAPIAGMQARDALEELPTRKLVARFLVQEQKALHALFHAQDALAALIDATAARLQSGGRLFYVGAGTSGRLGLLDAVECGPTFGVDDHIILPLLAGGQAAFVQAEEGAEDDEDAAILSLTQHGLRAADMVVGIAASGETPFTCAAIRHAAQLGAGTGAILNTQGATLGGLAAYPVMIDTGAEVILGSTRLSAGTTQKIALNILSSAVMAQLGHLYGPYMVDMRATNIKLRARALNLVRRITGADEPAAQAALDAAGMNVKTACLMLMRGLTRGQAKERLAGAENSLRRALNSED